MAVQRVQIMANNKPKMNIRALEIWNNNSKYQRALLVRLIEGGERCYTTQTHRQKIRQRATRHRNHQTVIPTYTKQNYHLLTYIFLIEFLFYEHSHS